MRNRELPVCVCFTEVLGVVMNSVIRKKKKKSLVQKLVKLLRHRSVIQCPIKWLWNQFILSAPYNTSKHVKPERPLRLPEMTTEGEH